jgi:PII-like signaling protein
MATQSVTVARIYIREGEHLLPEIVRFLHDDAKVSGVTVLRGIAGFGPDGKVHTASLVALSLDLPLVVEFYESPERVEDVITQLEQHLGLTHVVTWPAQVYTRAG